MAATKRQKKLTYTPINELSSWMSDKLIGQTHALDTVVPCIQMFQAGLSPEGRPVGVFLLMGPTGTGKTHLVEVLSEALHGSPKNLLRIDCGQFSLDHDVCKLLGSPPGYLGHRDTKPLLSQTNLDRTMSEKTSLSILLFDEIEKSSESLTQLLLGVLDKGTLVLGDNSTTDFSKTIIFMTSNLGAKAIKNLGRPEFGFESTVTRKMDVEKLKSVGITAVKKRFSPEFVNRMDSVIVFNELSGDDHMKILKNQLNNLRAHLAIRLEGRAFLMHVEDSALEFLIKESISPDYGAREMKRVIHRRLVQPLAVMVHTGEIEPQSLVVVSASLDGDGLSIETDHAQ